MLQEEAAEERPTENGEQEKPAVNGSPAKPAEEVNTEEEAIPDEPETSSRLEDPEVEDIKTITAGDTLYSSAKRFEDLPISEPLLQVIAAARNA